MSDSPVASFGQGPFVRLATQVDQILEEADGTLSLIRITDTTYLQSPVPILPDEGRPQVPVNLVFSLVAGAARGGHDATLWWEAPSGERRAIFKVKVNFDGRPNSVVNLVLRQVPAQPFEGVHYFDLVLSEQLLARVPWTVQTNFAGPGH